MNETMWLAAGIAVVGALVRLLKAPQDSALALAKFKLPPLPKNALPWASLILGIAYAILVERSHGYPWSVSAVKGALAGLGIGAGAIALHDVGKTVPGIKNALGVLILVSATVIGAGTVGATATGCTPEMRRAALDHATDLGLDIVRCLISKQALPNADAIKLCAVEEGKEKAAELILGEAREKTAAAAREAEERGYLAGAAAARLPYSQALTCPPSDAGAEAGGQ